VRGLVFNFGFDSNKVMFATVTTDPTSMFATIQLDIECPESIARAMAIDAETGTTRWQDAISEELKANKFQLVFYVKPDTLQRKVRLVMDEDTPITTNAIHTGSEVVAEAHLSTKTMAGPKEKSKKEATKKEKKQKSKPKPNKGKVPKKKFNMHNPAAYVTAAVWKSMSKEEQQAARDGRRELGIKTRNDNLPTTLQLPDFGKPDEVSSKGTYVMSLLPFQRRRRGGPRYRLSWSWRRCRSWNPRGRHRSSRSIC
jgi:hypothetical protein